MKRSLILVSLVTAVILLITVGCAPAPAPAPAPVTPAPVTPAPVTPAPVTPAPAPVEVLKWGIQVSVNPPGVIGYETVVSHFTDVINKSCQGRLEMETFPPNAIFPATEGLTAIGKGALEMCQSNGGYVAGTLGNIGNFETAWPGSVADAIELYNFFYKTGFLELVREEYTPHNIYFLCPHISSQWTLISNKPIRSVADFDGMKIRAYGTEALWFEKMGASTVLFPAGEIYTGLATGTIDAGRGGSPEWHESTGTYEVAPYLHFPWSVPAPCNNFLVNMDAWNDLTPDLQSIIDTTAQHASWAYVHFCYLEDAKSLARMQAKGLELVVFPDDEWAKMLEIVKEVWVEMAEGDAPATQALNLMMAYLADMGR